MAIYIEPHWCPLYRSILLTKWPICEIFTKKSWELAILKNALFLSWPFWIFFFKKKKFFFALFPSKSVQIYMVEWMSWNFDVFTVFQKIPCYGYYYVIQCITNCTLDQYIQYRPSRIFFDWQTVAQNILIFKSKINWILLEFIFC